MAKPDYKPEDSILAVQKTVAQELSKLKDAQGEFAASLRADLGEVLNVLEIALSRTEALNHGE